MEVKKMTEESYWDQLEQANQEESGSSGGLISLIKVETGFKVYATGVGQEESWFSAPASDKKARAVAKKAARALADEHDCAMNWGIGIVTPKEKSYKQGGPVTWSVPVLVRFTASFWDSCKDIVIPSLKANKIAPLPWQGWARLGFQPDPYAVEQDKRDKEGRYKQVAYITEVFADEAAAMKAVGEMPTGEQGEGLDVPDGFSEEDWAALADELTKLLKAHMDGGKSGQLAMTLVAKEVGVEPKYLKPLVDEIVPV
jgi:hypothetical protein